MEITVITQGPIETNIYIVSNQEECIIMDPELTAGSIIQKISEIHKIPKAILLTHGHFDHIGAVSRLRDYYNIPVYASKKEEALLYDSNLNLSGMIGKNYSITADKLLEDNETIELIGLQIQCLATPGHTSGSMSYIIENCCFSGDTIFEESYGRYDFPTGSLEALSKSIQKLLKLDENTAIYPGHGNPTTVEHERIYNPLR